MGNCKDWFGLKKTSITTINYSIYSATTLVSYVNQFVIIFTSKQVAGPTPMPCEALQGIEPCAGHKVQWLVSYGKNNVNERPNRELFLMTFQKTLFF